MAKRKSTYNKPAQDAYRAAKLKEGREEFLLKLDGADADRLRSIMRRLKLNTRQAAVRFALKNIDERKNAK